MKSTVFALLVANAQALTPIDGEDLDIAGLDYYTQFESGAQSCKVDSDCPVAAEGELPMSCMVMAIGDDAQTESVCFYTLYCGIAAQPIDDSVDTYTGICNDAATIETGQDLDVADFVYWDKYVSNQLTSCVDDDGCTGALSACATVSLDTLAGDYCVSMEDDCGSSSTVNSSDNNYSVSCTTDKYQEWLWKTTNETDQVTAAGCATVDPECTTITWDGSSGVAAFCGTATLGSDSNYSVMGCYPTADCEALGGSIPGQDNDELVYILTCGAANLFATAVATTAAVAYSI